MKDGTILFWVLAFISFISGLISFSLMPTLGFAVFISAVIAFLQAVAWVLIGYMWETVMD